MSRPLLEARRLARRHPDSGGWLLDHVSLAVEPGQRLAVTGPSGSGKTLLLRALALLDPVDSGEVFWQGEPVGHKQIPAYRRRVIYLHQKPALIEPTVEAAMERPFSLAVHQNKRFERERIIGWLETLGRDASLLAKSTRDLSGGEGQIAAVLRALQLDPHLLLLDEPTAAVDAATTRGFEQLLDHWLNESPQHRAYVWVSHDAEQARRVATRSLSINGGKLG